MSRRIRVMTATVVGAFLAMAVILGAGRLLASTLASHSAPTIVNYQGYVTDAGGSPISNTVTLVFRIWDASSGGSEVWSETHNNVPVNQGYFSVFLGSQGTPLTPSVFSSTSRYIEVTFGATTFGRQRFASVPYALVASHASEAITSTYATTATYALNAPSSSGGVDWQYVKVVAKSGGDYTSVTEAMNAINPSSAERYLVLVMPGVYEEQVTLKQYVHLKGAGIESTFISSAANDANFNQDAAATMLVPANVQVSNLTVRNTSTTNDGVALKISGGNAETILDNVQLEVLGAGGGEHIGLYTNGTPLLRHVLIEVSGGTSQNWGVFTNVSSFTMTDTTIRATGTNATAIRMNGGSPFISDSTLSGMNGSNGIGIDLSGAGVHNVTVDRSSIIGDPAPNGHSIRHTNNYNVFVGTSKLQGNNLVPNINIACAQTHNTDYVELNGDCK